ncbi:MAG: hypothetical protein KC486_18685, partial [Myxococcales bacterium]|nr:hypothetical protein [Myxococcales bacterium]
MRRALAGVFDRNNFSRADALRESARGLKIEARLDPGPEPGGPRRGGLEIAAAPRLARRTCPFRQDDDPRRRRRRGRL